MIETWFGRRTVAACLLLAVAGACVVLALRVAALGTQADFLTRYAAAQVAEQGGDPYDVAVLQARQREVSGSDENLFPLYDPPPTVAVFRGVQLLPLRAAQLAWLALSVAAVAALGVVAVRVAGAVLRWTPTREALLVGAVIAPALSPAKHALVLGQLDPLFAVPLLAATVLLLTGGRWRGAAPGLALLSLCKPQTFLLPVLVAVGAPLRRALPLGLLSLAGGAGVIALASWLLVPSVTWASWLDAAAGANSSTSTLLTVVRLLLLAVGLVVGLAALLAIRELPERTRIPAALALACAAEGLLAGVTRWNPQWSLLVAVPLAVLLLARLRRGVLASRADRLALAVAGGLLLTDGLNSTMWDSRLLSHALVPIVLCAALLAALVLADLLPRPDAALVLAVNAGVTLPVWSPRVHAVLALLAAVLLLGLLGRLYRELAADGRTRGGTGAVTGGEPTGVRDAEDGVRSALYAGEAARRW